MKSFTAVLLLPLAVLANPLRVPESVYDSEFGIRALQATLFPHYLNPINQATPDEASFTQYTGEAAFTATAHRNETRLLVGFDVPSDAGSRCAIKFQLPANVPGGFQWEVTGNGKLDVWSLVKEFKNGAVTWNTKPARKTEAPQFVITVSRVGAGMGGMMADRL